VNMHTTMTDHG